MAGTVVRFPVGYRIPMTGDRDLEFSGGAASLTDVGFGFFGEGETSQQSASDISGDRNEGGVFEVEEEEENENSGSAEESKDFWEEQHRLLQATLFRSSSIEARIRKATKEALRESQLAGIVCICRRPVAGGCRSCLLRDISDRLRNAGYDSAICRSKWKSTPDIPSGEHTYLDVVSKTSSKKGEVRVVIELNFRAEFEMARASDEYNQLIGRLPEFFVGKVERLKTLIKILCSAAKKCMKEKKMHMGPWRKHKYMQAKWLSKCERSTTVPNLPSGYSDRLPKPRASMLTFDLLEKLPSLHCKAVKVV